MREMIDEKIALALSSAARYTTAMKQNRFQFPADFSCIGNLASLPTTSQSPQTLSSRINVPTSIQNHQQTRKRRRGEVANPANTLDGLVAKRADDIGASDSLIKRYLTENEAIESPSDDQELKRIETDPDVSTRTCSICGYQGKWVSEMIRHKRVHTNERPFKCKYCSRTSKWKADLIRHVAKTHGIRVVSKYSRSKTFDASATGLHELKDNKPEALQAQSNITTHTINVKPLPTSVITSVASKKDDLRSNASIERSSADSAKTNRDQLPVAYRCVLCLFEQESILVLMSHLRNVHNAAPYECHGCNECFSDAQTAMSHSTTATKCSRTDLIVNIVPVYTSQQKLSPLSLLGAAGIANTQELLGRLMNAPATNSALMPLLNQLQITAALTSFKNTLSAVSVSDSVNSGVVEDFDKQRAESCDKCPYKGDADSFVAHKKGHEVPKGLLNYKCAFCDWFGKKKSAVEEHMKVHTENPQLYMSEVEKNLITPVTLAKYNVEFENSNQISQYNPSSLSSTPSSVLITDTKLPNNVKNTFDEIITPTLTSSTYDFAATLFALKHRSDITSLLPLQTLRTMANVPVAAATGSATPLQSPFSPLSATLAQMSPTLPEEVTVQNSNISPKLSPPLSGLAVFSSKDLPLIRAAANTATAVSTVASTAATNTANLSSTNIDGATSGITLLDVETSDTSADDNMESQSPTNSLASSETTNVSAKGLVCKYECSKCDAIFNESLDLECHSKFHGANFNCSCTLCDYSVTTADELTNHLSGHHNVRKKLDMDDQVQKSYDDEVVDVEHIENSESIRQN